MRETGTFHPSGKARQQQEGNREKVQAPRAGLGGFGVGVRAARAPLLPRSPARCSEKASFPSQISCLGFRRPEQGAEGAQE